MDFLEIDWEREIIFEKNHCQCEKIYALDPIYWATLRWYFNFLNTAAFPGILVRDQSGLIHEISWDSAELRKQIVTLIDTGIKRF